MHIIYNNNNNNNTRTSCKRGHERTDHQTGGKCFIRRAILPPPLRTTIMTITTAPSSFILVKSALKNSYNIKSFPTNGTWHLSYRLDSETGTTRSICGLVSACDIIHFDYFSVALDKLHADRQTRSIICKKCLRVIDRDGC